MPENPNGAPKPDPYQIAFISNNKTCIAAVSRLLVADLTDPKEKSPAAIHSRYSRIMVSVTDFSQTPSVYHTYYLEPAEIRRLHRQVMVHRGMKEFQYIGSKEKEKDGKRLAEVFRLDKSPYLTDIETGKLRLDANGNKILATYPWKLTIGKGEYTDNQKKPNMHKWTYKFLAENETEDFFSKLVAYLNVWELTFGPQQLVRIHETPFFQNGYGDDDDDEGLL